MSKPSVDEIIERGTRPCMECGRAHDCRATEIRQGKVWRRSWADPDDGHPYRPVEWAKYAAGLEDEIERLKEVVEAAERLKRHTRQPVNLNYVAVLKDDHEALLSALARLEAGDE